MIKHLSPRPDKEVKKLLTKASTCELISSMYIIDRNSVEYKELCKRFKVDLISSFKITLDFTYFETLLKEQQDNFQGIHSVYEHPKIVHDYEITVECHPNKLGKVLKNFRKIAHIKNYSLNKNMIFTAILTINFIFK